MIDHENLATEYVYKEISKRLVRPIDGRAYLWITEQITYYKKPTYLNNDYTNEVLKVLYELVKLTSMPGRHEDKDYMLLFICKL